MTQSDIDYDAVIAAVTAPAAKLNALQNAMLFDWLLSNGLAADDVIKLLPDFDDDRWRMAREICASLSGDVDE